MPPQSPDEANTAANTSSNSYSSGDDTTEDIDLEEWEEWDPSKVAFVDHMVAGSLAGLAEHVGMFPMDTIKTNIQCEKCGVSTSGPSTSTWQAARGIVAREGLPRLWRGVGAMFAGCVSRQTKMLLITAAVSNIFIFV